MHAVFDYRKRRVWCTSYTVDTSVTYVDNRSQQLPLQVVLRIAQSLRTTSFEWEARSVVLQQRSIVVQNVDDDLVPVAPTHPAEQKISRQFSCMTSRNVSKTATAAFNQQRGIAQS